MESKSSRPKKISFDEFIRSIKLLSYPFMCNNLKDKELHEFYDNEVEPYKKTMLYANCRTIPFDLGRIYDFDEDWVEQLGPKIAVETCALAEIQPPMYVTYIKNSTIIIFANYKKKLSGPKSNRSSGASITVPVACKFSVNISPKDYIAAQVSIVLKDTCPNVVHVYCSGTENPLDSLDFLNMLSKLESKETIESEQREIRSMFNKLQSEEASNGDFKKTEDARNSEKLLQLKQVFQLNKTRLTRMDQLSEFIKVVQKKIINYEQSIRARYHPQTPELQQNKTYFNISERIMSPYDVSFYWKKDTITNMDCFLGVALQLFWSQYCFQSIYLKHGDLYERNIWLQPIKKKYRYLQYKYKPSIFNKADEEVDFDSIKTDFFKKIDKYKQDYKSNPFHDVTQSPSSLGRSSKPSTSSKSSTPLAASTSRVNEESKKPLSTLSDESDDFFYLALEPIQHYILKIGDFQESSITFREFCDDLENTARLLSKLHKNCFDCKDELKDIIDCFAHCNEECKTRNNFEFIFNLKAFQKMKILPSDVRVDQVITVDMYSDSEIVDLDRHF